MPLPSRLLRPDPSSFGQQQQQQQQQRSTTTIRNSSKTSSSSRRRRYPFAVSFVFLLRVFVTVAAFVSLSLLYIATTTTTTTTKTDSYHHHYGTSSSSMAALSQSSTTTTTKMGIRPPPPNTKTIGYAVTITSCGLESNTTLKSQAAAFPIADAAAVLQYSIHRNSILAAAASTANSNTNGSTAAGGRYNYKTYAIYHPDAERCVKPLAALGYTLLKRPTPVEPHEIKGKFLREKISENGCCGPKELIKFEALRLVNHPAVVILDLDVLILKPLDALYDLMLDGIQPPSSQDHIMWKNKSIPNINDIWLLHTLDYAMVNAKRKVKPVQGGFVVIKPNVTIYDEIMDIVREGNYGSRGWDGKTGKFWGSMTFQGLMPYFYMILHRDHAVELNRCIHDNMCSVPREGQLWPDETEYRCFTQEKDCEDCRARPIDDIYSAHFTVCQKPWKCIQPRANDVRHKLCGSLHSAWFGIRSEMEKSWGRKGFGNSTWRHHDRSFGYCHRPGDKGYEPIQQPYYSYHGSSSNNPSHLLRLPGIHLTT